MSRHGCLETDVLKGRAASQTAEKLRIRIRARLQPRRKGPHDWLRLSAAEFVAVSEKVLSGDLGCGQKKQSAADPMSRPDTTAAPPRLNPNTSEV
jgi:hypothetical protein